MFSKPSLLRLIWAGVAIGVGLSTAFAQPMPAAGGTASVATTRIGALWAEQENTLDEALQKQATAPVQAMLADGFEFHATEPARHLDAQSWLAQERKVSAQQRSLRELRVQESGAVTLVSFVRVHGQHGLKAEFVVDVWRTADSKLLARYSSPSWRIRAQDAKPDGRH